MKLSELKRIAEEHGCYVHEYSNGINISCDDGTAALINKEKEYVLDTNWNVVTERYDKLKPVIAAAVEYAMTPIEDRNETELFYVRYPSISGVSNTDDLVYVNYSLDDNKYDFASRFQYGVYQTEFTPKEIDAMPESIQQAIRKSVLEVIEVSEVDG